MVAVDSGDSTVRPTAPGRRIPIADTDGALAYLLAGYGYDTAVTHSISGARALLAEEPFAALLTDPALPDGGRRWLAELRAKRPQLPVLVVTAEPLDALGLDRIYGLADGVLAKPTEPRVLVAMLDRVVGERGAS
jgi:DNA-binding response OmpR family regulator